MLPLGIALVLVAIARCAQPSAPRPEAAPIRPLQWAQLNFLHTTDTHGWHGGHLQEPSYSADWGDYISFANHMRDRADRDGADLLLVDTGDRIEGNGLYDASDPKGKHTFNVLKHQVIDVVTIGNHELYKANSSNTEYYETVPDFKDSYVASNVDIWDDQAGAFVPLAPRFKKIETKNQHIRIMAFGFLFNFGGSSNNTIVQRVQDSVKEAWFQDAIRDREVDLFLVAGHVAIRSEEYDIIFKAIRNVQWDTPIQFFGGHTHIRDFAKYDRMAYAIESGRYMETIGFMSIGGLNTAKGVFKNTIPSPTFSRRYIDNNLYSLHYHSGRNETSFPTQLGQRVTRQITEARKSLGLDARHGCAPRDLWMDRADIHSESSIFRWLGEEVIPDQLEDHRTAIRPTIVLSNTGAVRFDLFKGPFTRDTTYLISPFTSGLRTITNVEYRIAAKLLDVLNSHNEYFAALDTRLDQSLLSAPEQLAKRRLWATVTNEPRATGLDQATLVNEPSLIPGYTTKDDFGADGDDTIHSQLEFYPIPPCMQTLLGFPDKGNVIVPTVDIVYNEFIEPWILGALEFLGRPYKSDETVAFMEGHTFTAIIAEWVEKHWPCEEKDEL